MAPAKVRPTQTYEMYVTLFSMHYNDVTVRAVLSQDNEEYSTSQVVFYEKGTKRIQLMVNNGDSEIPTSEILMF